MNLRKLEIYCDSIANYICLTVTGGLGTKHTLSTGAVEDGIDLSSS